MISTSYSSAILPRPPLLPIFGLGFCFFDIELHVLLVNFGGYLVIASFANIFSQSVGCLFVLFMVSFAVQKLLSLIRSHLFIFVFISISLGGGSKRILL